MNSKQNVMRKYLNINIWVAFFTIYSVISICLILESHFVYTEGFLANMVGVDVAADSLRQMIARKKELFWINYFILIVIIWFPALAFAFCFKVGAILNNTKIEYAQIVNFTLKSQIIFAVNYFVFTILKLNHIIERDMSNLNNCFDYQSILSLIPNKDIPYWLMYPLQLVSISEFLNMIFCIYAIHVLFKYTTIRATKFYFVYYGFGLVFWIVFTIFLQTFMR